MLIKSERTFYLNCVGSFYKFVQIGRDFISLSNSTGSDKFSTKRQNILYLSKQDRQEDTILKLIKSLTVFIRSWCIGVVFIYHPFQQ